MRLRLSLIAAGLLAAGGALANEDVLRLQAIPGNSVMPSITYNGWNYSPLTEINLGNVGELGIAWTFTIPIADSHEAPPLVVGDRMYILSPKPNHLYAIDLNETPGRLLWEYQPEIDVELATANVAYGGQTRGVYYGDGKLFMGTLDGQVIAVDANTGEEIWRRRGTEISQGEAMAGNGLVVGNLVIFGNEGGERGVRGKIHAYDIDTGEPAWVMYSMGPDADVGIGPRFNPFYPDDRVGSVSTWYGQSWRRGGGIVFGYFTWDQESNLLHYSTGNCGPWNPDYRRQWGVVTLDDAGGLADYRNNWCASELARDATTGELIWAYNITPADNWDLDEPVITPLVDLEIGGQMRETAIKATRMGYFYVWDRNTGELLTEPWPFRFVDLITGVDMETGRALYDINKWSFTFVEDRRRYTDFVPTFALGRQDYTGTEIAWCPGHQARNWHNDAYSPRTGLLYTSTSTGCATQVVIEGEYAPGEGYTLFRGAGDAPIVRTRTDGTLTDHYGELQANHPVESRLVWAHEWNPPNQLPVMATAADLLFQGGSDAGVMRAFNAVTGEIVLEYRIGARFNQTPITYQGPDGRQYVAIVASAAMITGAANQDALPDLANRYRRQESMLYVFGLPN